MRVRHIEQALAGIYALRPTYQAGLDCVSTDVERLGHLIWNGYAAEAGEALWALTHLSSEAIYLNGEHIGHRSTHARLQDVSLRARRHRRHRRHRNDAHDQEGAAQLARRPSPVRR